MPDPRWRRFLRSVAALPIELRAVLLVAALVHGIGLSWGMPSSDAWDNDGVAPRDILPGVLDTYSPGSFYTYPPLQLLILAVLTLPVTVAAVVKAGTTAVPAVIHEIIQPPYMTAFSMTARIVTLLMSLGIVTSIALAAEEIAPPSVPSKQPGTRRIGTFAAVFLTLDWAFSYYSHVTNLDVPYLFWATLGLLQFVRAISRNEPKRFRLFALFAAMAVATKDQAYAMYIVSAPVILAVWLLTDRAVNVKKTIRELAIGAGLGLAVILVIDGALFNPTGFRARLRFLSGPASKNFEIFPHTFSGRVTAFLDSYKYFQRHYPPLLAVVPALGFVVLWFRAKTKLLALLPAFVAISFSLAFNCVALRSEERFTLPQMLMLSIYAGAALDLLWARWITRPLVLACVVYAGIELVRVDATLIAEPRYDVEAWLAANAKPTDTIETHGLNVYLPRIDPQLHFVRVGKNDPKKRGPIPGLEEVQAPLMDIGQRSPRFVVVSECFIWRYMQRTDVDPKGGYRVPESQRAEGGDADSWQFFHALFESRLGYHLVHESRVRGFERAWIHASLGCPMFVFEKNP